MKIIQFLTRLVVMVCVCGLIVFANVSPANAAWGRPDKATQGTEPLPNITAKSEEAAISPPSGMKKAKALKGLNEVQGTADIDKMKRDNYGDKLPVVQEAEKVADKVENKIDSAKRNTKKTADSVLDQASDVVNDVKNKAGDVLNSLTGKAETTADSVKDTAESVKNKAKSLADKSRNNLRR
jgi:hypothetical protein